MSSPRSLACRYCGGWARDGLVCTRCGPLVEPDEEAHGGGAPLTETQLGVSDPYRLAPKEGRGELY